MRSRLIQTMPGQPPFSLVSLWAKATAAPETRVINANEASPSQPISAGVPRSIVPSNQYRSRSRSLLRMPHSSVAHRAAGPNGPW
ncbi:hypothetical protein ACFQ10_45745 [Streptomyces indonesiensis]